MNPFKSLTIHNTFLITTFAASSVFVPSCLSKVVPKVRYSHLIICLGASAAIACLSVYIRRKYLRCTSKWMLAFSFGARLAGVRFIERYIDDPNDATNALTILQTMVKTDKHIHKFVVELGGVETTVKAMKRYSEGHDGVASSGSGLISAICGCSSSTDHKLMDCGAIRALVRAMKFHPNNEEVQAHASEALYRLAKSEERDIQKKIIDVGGLIALAQARTNHQHDARVNEPATNAIILLVTQENEPIFKSWSSGQIKIWQNFV